MTTQACSICGGKGFTLTPTGEAAWCECKRMYDARSSVSSCGIPKRLLFSTIGNYTGRNSAQDTAKKNAEEYIHNFGSIVQGGKNGLIFTGRPGCGKSHLAAAVLKRLIKDGHDGRYANVPTVFDSIRASFNAEGDREDIAADLMRAEVLVLDDLGTEHITDWVTEQLYLIINSRYNDMLATIITTNLTTTQLEQRYDARIMSRICEMCQLVEIE